MSETIEILLSICVGSLLILGIVISVFVILFTIYGIIKLVDDFKNLK